MQGAEVPQTYSQYWVSLGEGPVQSTAWISVENQWLSSANSVYISLKLACFLFFSF